MIYHGRVLSRLPESVVLGEYILLRQRGVFYGTRINFNQQTLTVYRPVFTGSFKNQGEVPLFIDRNSGLVYQFNPLLGQTNFSAFLTTSPCPANDTYPWIVSRFTGINDDGREIFYLNEGRIERRVPMTTLFINRATNVSLARHLIDLPLEVHLNRITILNESQLQIPQSCTDGMTIPVELLSFVNGSTAVLIYSFYENSQKIVVNHSINRVLLNDIHVQTTGSQVEFNQVNFFNGWIVDFPDATYTDATYWQQGEYIARSSGIYDVVFRLNGVHATLGSVINLKIQINTNNEFTQSFTLNATGGDLVANMSLVLSAESSLRFGYSSNNELPIFTSGLISVTPRV